MADDQPSVHIDREFAELTFSRCKGKRLLEFLPPIETLNHWKLANRTGNWRVSFRDCIFDSVEDLTLIDVAYYMTIERCQFLEPFLISKLPNVSDVRLLNSPNAIDFTGARNVNSVDVRGGVIGREYGVVRLRFVNIENAIVDVIELLARSRSFSRVYLSNCEISSKPGTCRRCVSLSLDQCLSDDWSWLADLEPLRYLYLRRQELPPVEVLRKLHGLHILHVPGDLKSHDGLTELSERGVLVLVGRKHQRFQEPKPKRTGKLSAYRPRDSEGG